MSVVVTVAPTGPLAQRSDNPALPTQPEEIAAAVVGAYRLGASVAHLHFRDEFDRGAIQRLYHVKHQVLRLRNAVYPVEDMCGQLIRLHEDLVPKELRAYFRDIEDHCSRIVRSLDVVREMLTTAVQVNLALVTVTQNEVVKRLAGWGAILALPTVVFSLYGMNFSFMPELKWQYGYPAALGVVASVCLYLLQRFRRAGWL